MTQIPEEKIQLEIETLGIKAVAQSLSISRPTILRWIHAGKVKGFFRIGHKWLIRKVDFDSFINQKIIHSSKEPYEPKS